MSVAIPNSTTASLPLGHADLLLTSLADVTLNELVRRHAGTVGPPLGPVQREP